MKTFSVIQLLGRHSLDIIAAAIVLIVLPKAVDGKLLFVAVWGMLVRRLNSVCHGDAVATAAMLAILTKATGRSLRFFIH